MEPDDRTWTIGASAWVTLVTQASYLPGAILLGFSLHRQQSKYKLIILSTSSFPDSLVQGLEKECLLMNAEHIRIESLEPKTATSEIAARFKDTWTKLRVFELWRWKFKRIIFLDADMLVIKNMDELFEIRLPENWIAANHACVCNLDSDPWAPKDWTKENCAYTDLQPGGIAPVPKGDTNGKRTHKQLNSGLFVFDPTPRLWDSILQFFSTDPRVSHYQFPDQDLLTDFFEDKWMSIGWQYNALKTWEYWHPNIWEWNEVRNLHFIVDKPWAKRLGEDRVAGYLGKDYRTHLRWWDEFDRWMWERTWMRDLMPPPVGQFDALLSNGHEDFGSGLWDALNRFHSLQDQRGYWHLKK